jgi:very-short-patch-repair endonuclease
VELDGARAHSSPAQLAADARKQADLERLGHTVIRFTHERVAADPGEVAAVVRALLPA